MKSNRRLFLKQIGFAAAAWSSLAPIIHSAPVLAGRAKLSRSTPEAQGVSSQGILAFLDALAQSQHEFHSFMLVRHGQIVAEGWWSPYRPELNHTLYSLSKSFTSTAVGLAAAEGRLKVNDPVSSFFPESLPEKMSENQAALRVKDLLTMSVGHAQDSTGAIRASEDWVKTFLALPIQHRPGTVFLYNSGATYMLSAIVQKVTGERLIDYLKPRLFDPLAIEGMTWDTCPRGINTGGWGLSVQTESLAKFGQLYRQKGAWAGQQLLPAEWVAEATTFKIQQPIPANPKPPRTQNDWLQGYCYQFWRSQHGAYRGDGAFGQYTIVMPEQDAVLAITSETANMQGELDLVWQHLLPAMGTQPLAEDAPAQTRLKERLGALTLPPPKCAAPSAVADKISGKIFGIEPNSMQVTSLAFRFAPNAGQFSLRDEQGEYAVDCGIERWVLGETSMPGTPPNLVKPLKPTHAHPSKVAASGAWKDERTFQMTWRFCETPHHDIVTCRFTDKDVRVEFMNSITAMNPAGKDSRPALIGHLKV